VFLPAISSSQHNSLHRPRASAAAATDLLIPPHPLAVFVYSSKRCAVAVTTDNQSITAVQRLAWHAVA